MMDGPLFRMTRDHLAELTSVFNQLNSSGFGGQGGDTEHNQRCEKALIQMEEMICGIVEELHKNPGQVA